MWEYLYSLLSFFHFLSAFRVRIGFSCNWHEIIPWGYCCCFNTERYLLNQHLHNDNKRIKLSVRYFSIKWLWCKSFDSILECNTNQKNSKVVDIIYISRHTQIVPSSIWCGLAPIWSHTLYVDWLNIKK